MQPSRADAVELYWTRLGASGRFVSFNGRVVRAIEAAGRHRQRCGHYHVALVLELNGDRYTIEMAPLPDADEASRGVVGTGAVGSRYVGWLRLFRLCDPLPGAGSRPRVTIALLDAWAGAAEVMVIEAVSSGAPTGTVHRLDAAAEPLGLRERLVTS
jgi:hypothetical protein